jgi:hypothetical protein
MVLKRRSWLASNSEHQVLVFCVMTPCSVVGGYRHFGETCCLHLRGKSFFVIPFYLQSVLAHSANCVKTYTMACRRVLISAPLQLICSKPLKGKSKLQKDLVSLQLHSDQPLGEMEFSMVQQEQ